MEKLHCRCQQPNRVYSFAFDANYCADCREWLESKCSDELCEYCANRPETPPMWRCDAPTETVTATDTQTEK